MNAVPDYFAPLLAYRTWAVQANGLLSGLSAAQPWRPRHPMAAVCNGHAMTTAASLNAHFVEGVWYDAPADGCSCGIYALKAKPAYVPWCTDVAPAGLAIGEVWLWGRVVEHRLGFRAQYAYPKSLEVYGTPELAALVASVYDIETTQKETPRNKQEAWYSLGKVYFTPGLIMRPFAPPPPTMQPSAYSFVSTWLEDKDYEPNSPATLLPMTTLQGVNARAKRELAEQAGEAA